MTPAATRLPLIFSLLVPLIWSNASGQQTLYQNMTVMDGALVGTVIGQVGSGQLAGWTQGAGPPYQIYYGTQSDSAVIGVTTDGNVFVAGQINRQQKSKFQFVAVSQDNIWITVNVFVIPASNVSPVFSPPYVNISISESAPLSALFTMGLVSELGTGTGNGTVLRCTILSGNTNNVFRLVTSAVGLSGALSVQLGLNAALDYESVQFYNLIVRAYDSSTPPHFGDLSVYVSITDVNDNVPKFNLSTYSVSIPENSAVGRSVLRVFASDSDTSNNGRITYSIDAQQSVGSLDFNINAMTGIVSVARPLNVSVRRSYSLYVIARDGGTVALQATTVATIAVTRVPVSTPVVQLIFLSDDGSASIVKSANSGDLVAQISVVYPSNPSSVNMTLVGGDGHFNLRYSGSTIYLMVVADSLDDASSSYAMSIVAIVDGNVVTKNFTLSIVADSSEPSFSQSSYYVPIDQIAIPGTSVLQLSVVGGSQNAKYAFRIRGRSGSRSEWFSIDRSTGLITTGATFDCLTVGDYAFNVTASDVSAPKFITFSTLVTIRVRSVSRHPPYFGSPFYSASVAENSQPSTCLLQVSAQAQGCGVNSVKYAYAAGLTPLPFNVDPTTGSVCVSGLLNYTSRSTYEFNVTATDQDGHIAVALIQLNVQPVYTRRPVLDSTTYSVFIDVNLPPGSALVAVSATNYNPLAVLSYQIVGGNLGSVFVIDPTTGLIRVKRPLALQLQNFSLSVAAVDNNGLSSELNAIVMVTVFNRSIDPRPVFNNQLYAFSIANNASEGSVVGVVNMNVRSGIIYSIIQSSMPFANLFIIDQLSGQLSTGAVGLNRVSSPFVLLTVRGELQLNSTLFNLCQVKIAIVDVNNHTPVFSTSSTQISIREDADVGSLIYSARATYQDVSLNSRVQYSLNSNTFAINNQTGDVTLTRRLDFELISQYTVTVTAANSRDQSRSTTFLLFVSVLDLNDVAPVFSSPIYSFNVNLPLPFGARIGTVAATNGQTGEYASLTYFLRNGRLSDLFDVRANTGEIYSRNVFDAGSQSRYILQIVATDNGTPALSSTATVLITLNSPSVDGTPSFSSTRYVFNVTEGLPSETSVGVVAVTGVSQPKFYLNVQNHTYFSIIRDSGEILTLNVLDCEDGITHQFSVGVVGHPQIVASVVVNVLGVNEHAPQFLKNSPSIVNIAENQPIGSSVMHVVAIDHDLGSDGKISYFFAPDNNKHYYSAHFAIDQTSGLITTRQMLQHRTSPEFTLKIIAKDHGRLALVSSPLILTVYVGSSTADSLPVLSSVSFSVQENADVGTVLGYTDDVQRSRVGENNYYIVNGNTFGSFGVNCTNGALYVALPLKFDDCSSYSITILVISADLSTPPMYEIVVNISVVSVFVSVPQFDSELVFISVRENLPVGSGVTTVSATCSGEREVVHYFIVSQIPNGTWFTVDANTGFLSTAAEIDREQVKQIAVTVAATLGQHLPTHNGVSTATLVAVVIDENDNAPTFESVNSVVNVSEDEALGFPVMTVVAKDLDLGKNGLVSYSILTGNEYGHFQLDSSTGVLTVIRSLDRETTSSYLLNISAADNGVPSLSSIMVLTVLVRDVNDNPPVFVKSLYNVSILENQPRGLHVVTVSATDFDDPTTMNTLLTYSIPNGVAGNNFQINSTTGAVTTTSTLDRETRSNWIVTVYVHNAGYPAFYDTTALNVVVRDVNDNPPVFSKTTNPLTLNIPENANMAVVHTVEAYDADVGDNGHVSYYISGGNIDGRFYLDPSTGRLSCTPLDRELVATYNLSIVAFDKGVPMLSAVTYINVVVGDDNDNDPLFQQQYYSASIPENTPIGTVIMTLQAIDLDEDLNGNVSYFLSNTADGIFDINPLTGIITLILSPDYESVTSFSIDAQSTDACPYGPRSRSVRVDINILDINDNSPVFSEKIYYTDIGVDFPVSSLVVTVVATDADSGSNARMLYSLVNASQYFQIDSTSGAITTRRHLDISAVGVQSLNVIAIDSGSPPRNSTCVVLVNIGLVTQTSSVLRFTNQTYTAYVLEHSLPGTVVLTVTARVNGTSPAVYGLAYGDNIFDIDPHTGVITVADSILLDRETSERVRAVVFATTAAGAYDYANVWITVIDINDNIPRFSQERYQSKVWENSVRGTFVAQVMASDGDPDSGPNGQIEYFIVSGNPQSAFDIREPSTGVVMTNIILDREVTASYRLEIAAVDKGNPPRSSTVIMRIQVIDVNDNAPFFPPYYPVSVREVTMVGTVLLQVTATDVDLNPSLTYVLNTANDTFSIDKYSGVISVIQPLDYEICLAYNLTVVVYDENKAHSAVTTITVNILDDNDNAPVFTLTSYVVSVNELTGPGSYIMTVNATDKDIGENGRVSYTLLPADSFYIDSTTGSISTNKLLIFNPLQPVIFLVVSATDHGSPSLLTTIAIEIQVVDVNDHAPMFVWPFYSVSVNENAIVGTSLVHLSATDADYTYDNTKLEYYIVAGNVNETFMITESLNSVDIVLVSALDRELKSSYTLSVVVSDNGLPLLNSSTQVNITVLDVNDVAPIFDVTSYNASVLENVTIGTRVLTVHAMDSDLGEAGRVTYDIVSGDGTDHFSIDSNSGTLSVRLALDYENKSSYALVVRAVDNGPSPRLSAYTEVVVNLLDVNEFRPLFPKLIYIEHVLTNQLPGTFVCNAEAPDRDAGPYGVVRYQLVPLTIDSNGTFMIDAESGCVYTSVMFSNSSLGASFSFKILAVDAAGFEGTAGLLITVHQPLTFARSTYQFKIHGSAQVGDEVGRVQVDTPANSADPVEYSLKPKNDYFDIRSTTGVIFVVKNLWDKSSSTTGNVRRRRRQSVESTTVSLNVVARTRGTESSVVVQINVNWTACCSGLVPAVSTSSLTTSLLATATPLTSLLVSASTSTLAVSGGSGESSGLSGTPLVVLIVIVSVVVIVVGVVAIVCLQRRRRRHRNKSPPSGVGDYGPSTIESSSLETFDVPPPAFGGFRPPPYHQSKITSADIGYYAARNVNGTTSEMTGEDDGAESSGRGSAEKNPGDDLDDDDEIRIINAVMSEIGGGSGVAYSQLRRARVPDSGIQPDQEDDAESESSTRDRAYLARLGIDVGPASRAGLSKVAGGLQSRRGPSSVESIHQFSEEGGGEAAMPDDSSITDRRSSDGEDSSSSRARRDRCAPIVDAEEVFSSSFNWDYLLDWKPEYRPLADVFAEIARLPDERAARHRVAKTCPTQIVPQRTSNQRKNPTAARSTRDGPPPIITNVPPLAVKVGSDLNGVEMSCGPISSGHRSSLSSTCSSTSSNRRHPLSMPPSAALTYESSFNSVPMSPLQTPSMSPLGPCSPSVSPLDQSIALHRLPLVADYRSASGMSRDVALGRRGQRNASGYDCKEVEI